MKRFNVTGICVPEKHYMVDIGGKIAQIKKLVDNESYFTINRARQYGKTTTLHELEKKLAGEYTVVSISFEELGDESFASAERFCPVFIRQIVRALRFTSAEPEYIEQWADYNIADFDSLGEHITKMCENKKVVLLIDEVDKTSNNRVFLHFLSTLRGKYLKAQKGKDHTFHSVVLAGVYDIKNIKVKMIKEGLYTPLPAEDKIYNSPWNIAVDFEVDMSFGPTEIAGMLRDYEADHHTGMDIAEISEEIHKYTSGYPFLVSRICQHIDEKFGKEWTAVGIQKAIKAMVPEQNTLFSSLCTNLENSKTLYNFIYDIMIVGKQRTFSAGNPTISLALMYGMIKNENEKITVSNKIFELVLCDYFISKDEEKRANEPTGTLLEDVLREGRFDMELCLNRFAEHYHEIYSGRSAKFLEREGKFLFLTYLKPLINGQGFYHFESQLSDERRMDIVVDFGRDQFIVELKIWRGKKYEEDAYGQLLGYMETKKATKGYLLVFDFRKDVNKTHKAEWVKVDGKEIFEVVI